MAEKGPDQEPSIEEILASIRQIISDDDEQDSKGQSAAPAKVPEPEPEPDDVVELTERVDDDGNPAGVEDAPAEEPRSFREVMQVALQDSEEEEEPSAPEPEEEEPYQPEPVSMKHDDQDEGDDEGESIMTERASRAALAGFTKLARNLPVHREESVRPLSGDGVTLEDIVRDLLNPMLRDWMDHNLPPLIERLVQKELEKLARRALDQ